jgi:uncharacterized protein (DUF697 family)
LTCQPTSRCSVRIMMSHAGEMRTLDLPESLARRIINKHMWLAMGVGLLPLPLVDMTALMAIQIRMLRQLSQNYNVPFHRDIVKKLIGSLLGAVIPTSLGTIVGSGLKLVPVVGSTIGAISMPIFAGATTLAIGKIFMQHFESGGTFLDFEPAGVRAYFKQEFEESQKLAWERWEMQRKSGTQPPGATATSKPPSSADG